MGGRSDRGGHYSAPLCHLAGGLPDTIPALRTHASPCEEPAFLQAASELGLPRYTEHTLVPTSPQLSDGLASLVAVPKWIAATDKVIVVLDFSYWRGPVYATIDRSFITLASLAGAARRHTQVQWQVYHASNLSPIAEGGHVVADNGDVFYFVPAGTEPPRRFLFTDLLHDPRLWSSYPQFVPKEIHRAHLVRAYEPCYPYTHV